VIDRQGGEIVVECDSCDQVLHTGTNDFAEAREAMKREDWRVRKIAGEWLHGCPSCGVPS
jgi:uncharacterized C2H2 Zn-finger protein